MLENEHFFCSPFEALYFNNLQRRNTLESAQYRTPRSWMIQRQGWLIILSSERVYDQLMLALSRWNFLFNIRKNHYNYCGYVVVTIKHKCTLYIYACIYTSRIIRGLISMVRVSRNGQLLRKKEIPQKS